MTVRTEQQKKIFDTFLPALVKAGFQNFDRLPREKFHSWSNRYKFSVPNIAGIPPDARKTIQLWLERRKDKDWVSLHLDAALPPILSVVRPEPSIRFPEAIISPTSDIQRALGTICRCNSQQEAKSWWEEQLHDLEKLMGNEHARCEEQRALISEQLHELETLIVNDVSNLVEEVARISTTLRTFGNELEKLQGNVCREPCESDVQPRIRQIERAVRKITIRHAQFEQRIQAELYTPLQKFECLAGNLKPCSQPAELSTARV